MFQTTSVTIVSTEQRSIQHIQMGEHHKLGPIYAVEVKRETVRQIEGALVEPVSKSTVSALVDSKGLADVQQGRDCVSAQYTVPSVSDPKRKETRLVLAYPAELVKLYSQELHYEGFNHKKDLWPLIEAGAPVTLVEVDYSNGQLRDMAGKLLPKPLLFEYCGDDMTDHSYNLERAVEILAARPDVELIPNAGERWIGRGEPPMIGRIPYYNAEEDRSLCIKFVLRLDAEQYNRFHALPKKWYNMKHALLREDYLGLIAGGAAKYLADGTNNPAYVQE